MHWLKRDIWKAGIAVTGLLCSLVLLVWVPVSAGANEGASGLVTPVITAKMQATPTVDATMTTLQKEQLTLQVNQLQNQKSWLENNSTALIAAVATVVVALFGISQWAINRRDERRKEIAAQYKESKDRQAAHYKDLRAQAEERFKTAVVALGDDKESVQIGGAILLRSFLNPEDKEIFGRYYTQIFDLAVAYLCLPTTSSPTEDANTLPSRTPLRQALITVFREAYPVARDRLKEQDPKNQYIPRSLDARGIKLDGAHLVDADLKEAWMPEASLRGVNLLRADLSKAALSRANLSQAYIKRADLRGAFLDRANINGADLSDAELSGATFYQANLSGANIEDAFHLEKTYLHGVNGLTKEELTACKAKGAIIDEDTTANPPKSTDSSPTQSQSNV